MAVTLDAGNGTKGTGVTSLTTPALTITSNANRAGIIDIMRTVNDVTSLVASLGGVSGSTITGTDTGTSLSYRTLQMQVIAPPSGSQTATASWTTSCNAVLNAKTAYGVDQTTPFNNGTFAFHASNGLPTLSITSTNGDLTDSLEMDGGSAGGNTTNQNFDYSQFIATGNTCSVGGDHGPGTGTATHTWTIGGTAWLMSGSNFNQAAAGIGAANLTSSAGRFIGWTV